MFTGLDELDWGSMSHAYGDAAGVPALLRGLIDDDPAVRERALDAMYGAVHHQGDVYDSTLAAIPFLLEIAGTVGLRGRGEVVSLLASIGGADDEGDPSDDPNEQHRQARAAVTAARPLFVGLLSDVDVEVRRAVPAALLIVRVDVGPVVAALRAHFTTEPDPEVRKSIITTIGAFGRRGDDADAGAWLAGRTADGAEPQLRLAAIAEVAGTAPHLLPDDVVPNVLALLRVVYDTEGGPAEPAGFSTDTLIGALREMSEREAADRRAPDAAALVGTVSRALGERIEDRARLLTELLRHGDWEARHDALWPANMLVEGWRGDFGDIVALIGERLFDEHPRLPGLAARVLEHFDVLAAPAAEALARSLDTTAREAPNDRGGLPPWVVMRSGDLPSVGATLQALAGARDPRALSALEWALQRPEMAGDVGYVIAGFGTAAAGLIPAIRRRLADLPTPERYFDRRRGGLAVALGRMGGLAGPAVPELAQLIAGSWESPEILYLKVLQQIGPAAGEAAPLLRRLLAHGNPRVEIAAAAALWQVAADPAAVVAVLARHLDTDDHWPLRAAVDAVAGIRPAAEATVARLRQLLHHGDDRNGWIRKAAATGLWRATADVEAALPTLTAVWDANLFTRRDIVDCVAEMGPAAGAFEPRIRAELALRTRHTARGGGSSTSQIPDDLDLLRSCESALDGGL